jgi:hypothetical protein
MSLGESPKKYDITGTLMAVTSKDKPNVYIVVDGKEQNWYADDWFSWPFIQNKVSREHKFPEEMFQGYRYLIGPRIRITIEYLDD